MLDLVEEPLELLDVEHRLRDCVLGAGVHLPLEALDLVRHVEDRPGHDRRYAVDSAKLRGLGWAPQHNFDAGGLEETVEWYRANAEWWEPIKSGEYRRYYDQQYAARLA